MKLPILVLIFSCYFYALATESYKNPSPKQVSKRINYLERVIKQPLNADSEIMNLSQTSYEFMLFSYSFSTYALTNLALKDTHYRKQALEIIKIAVQRTLDNKITSTYGVNSTMLLQDSIPNLSVLYLGHLNLMLGCYRLISSDSIFNKLNDKISKSLFKRYSNSKFLNLESYTNSIWIPDNTVALASLKMHSTNTGSQYETVCKRWIDYAKAHYLDKKTGVLFSTINPETGKYLEEPRGSMLGWSIMFISQFDQAFAVELYKNYKKHFSKNYIVFRLFKERYKNTKTAVGDIDSGPIIRGISIPANEFALSNALIAKDYKTANQLKRLINFGTKQIETNNELKYKLKFVPKSMEINMSPMAEALVLFSLTITKWTND